MRMIFVVAFCILLPVPYFCSAQSQQQAQSSSRSQTHTSQENPSPQNSQAPLRVDGNVMQKKLLHMVSPVYPEIAKMAHVSGTVLLHAIISKDGSVKEVKVISGPDLLIGAAMEAVKQWTYQPTLLNGQPVEADTTIAILFSLSDGGTFSSPSAPNSNPPEGGIAVIVPAQASAPPIDPQLKAGIVKLLGLTHAIALGQQAVNDLSQDFRPAILASLPATPHRDQIADAYIAKLAGLLAGQEVLDRLTSIYAEYFSTEDVNAMIQFYQTPVGQKTLATMPKVMEESRQAGDDVATENLPRIFSELCREYPELQGKVKFCSAPSQSESSQLLRKELKSMADSPALSRAGAQ